MLAMSSSCMPVAGMALVSDSSMSPPSIGVPANDPARSVTLRVDSPPVSPPSGPLSRAHDESAGPNARKHNAAIRTWDMPVPANDKFLFIALYRMCLRRSAKGAYLPQFKAKLRINLILCHHKDEYLQFLSVLPGGQANKKGRFPLIGEAGRMVRERRYAGPYCFLLLCALCVFLAGFSFVALITWCSGSLSTCSPMITPERHQ